VEYSAAASGRKRPFNESQTDWPRMSKSRPSIHYFGISVNSEHKEFKKLKRGRFGIKTTSVVFLVIGGMMFAVFLMAYLDPEATINVNGEPTTSPKAKLQALVFTSFFVLIGVAGLLAPKNLLNRMIVARESFMPSSVENLLQKQYRLMNDHPLVICSLFAIFMLFATGRDFLRKVDDGEKISAILPEFLFVFGFGVAFFYFGFKLMVWIMLKMGGYEIRPERNDQ
jgi:hypothetical protein